MNPKQALWLAVLSGLLSGCALFASSYRALEPASPEWQRTNYGWLLPSSGEQLIVFYPGGKVKPEAYKELLQPLAEQGYDLALVQFPLDLAVLRTSRARAVLQQHPAEQAILVGHSLGGAMAARFAGKNPQSVQALVLLAAYSLPSAGLERNDLPVLSLLGDQDGLISVADWQNKHPLLPSSAQTYLILGGNHAQFGSYGEQEGDNPAQISAQQQQAQTRELMLVFLRGD